MIGLLSDGSDPGQRRDLGAGAPSASELRADTGLDMEETG